MEAKQFYKIAKALADPRRFEILKILAATQECCCSELGEKIPLAQPTISHHLKELSNAGLIEARKEGQHSYYHLHPEVLTEYIQELHQITTATAS